MSILLTGLIRKAGKESGTASVTSNDAHLHVLVLCGGGGGDAGLVPAFRASHPLMQHVEAVDVERHLILQSKGYMMWGTCRDVTHVSGLFHRRIPRRALRVEGVETYLLYATRPERQDVVARDNK